MFRNCTILENLNLSNFNTSKVTNMNSMFLGCNNLTTLDLSSFDTSNVTKMDYMFMDNSNLVYDCSEWNVNLVTTYTDFNRGADNVTAPKWVN